MVGHSVIRSGPLLVIWLALTASGFLIAAPRDLLAEKQATVDLNKEALARLSRLPLAERTTVEHHVAVARAAASVDDAAQVAEAVGTAGLLPAQATPRSIGFVSEELPPLREWLEKRADEYYESAVMALRSNDMKAAARSYLLAVKCNPALLGREDHGLAKLSLGALQRMVGRYPDRTDLRFQLGYYSYLLGDTGGAVTALEQHQTTQTEPYKKWRGQVWLAVIRADRDLTRAAGAAPTPDPTRRSAAAVASLFGGHDGLPVSR